MKSRRLAIMRIANQLLEGESLETFIRLPANARIDAVSVYQNFMADETTVRIECDDFIETPVGFVLPYAWPTYNENGFVCWNKEILRTDK